MKILWLVNVPFSLVSDSLNIPAYNKGGWLEFMSKQILKQDNTLIVLLPGNVNTYVNKEKFKIYSFKKPKIDFFRDILQNENPDVIHIWGTEYKHSLCMIQASKTLNKLDKTFVSIQGPVYIYSNYHYLASLPFNALKSNSLHDFIRRSNIIKSQKIMQKNARYEVEGLKIAEHVIGRTSFDYIFATQTNPLIKYHKCYETLREGFYQNKWTLDKCQKHSVFAPQGNYPLKGFHFLIEAAHILKKKYPDIKVYAIGNDIFNIPFYRISTYLKYIKSLILKYDLKNNIIFTGSLDERQMIEFYLKAHVFVCPSSIENSSNSIGEAMCLGVPSVVSFVGGNAEFIKHEHSGYVYPYDAPYFLADYLDKIFTNNELALMFSNNAKNDAKKFYDPINNFDSLMKIYKKGN